LPDGLAWQPKREDLERLYLVEKLSAAKIAKFYGLRCKNPKVAESTVLYHLKSNGIKRRDRADHIRKVTEELVDEWVRRYDEGESLKKIAGGVVSPVTVWYNLRSRGIVLRDKIEAQIKAVTKYERRPFQGDSIDRAYLMGLRYGDLHVVEHGRAIRVRVSTTHPAMANLFESLFSPYGVVHRYPRRAKLVGFEWTLECDLDKSFEFLLQKATPKQLMALSREESISFLAGLFDAEGSIVLHNKRGRHNPEATISNTKEIILQYSTKILLSMGFHCKTTWRDQAENRGGITGYSRKGQLVLWRFLDVQKMLGMLPIRHPERLAKAAIVGKMQYRGPLANNLQSAKQWGDLICSIKSNRVEFVDQARLAIVGHNEKP
jgi:hypothetical protein